MSLLNPSRRSTFFALLMLLGALAIACDDSEEKPASSCDSSANREVTGLSNCTVRLAGHHYLGVLQPYTGSLSGFGASIDQAIQLAVREIDAAGGIDGQCLGLVVCDSATDPVTAAARAQELAAANPVLAVLGPAASSEALQVIPILAAAKKVMLSPSATSPAIAEVDDQGFFFRTAVSDAVQGRIVAAIAKREGLDKVFVIHRDDAYGNGLNAVFASAFEGETQAIAYDEAQPDFDRNVLAAAQAYAPDAVFLISFVDDGATILKAAAAAGWTSPRWLLPDGPKDPSLLTKVGDAAFLEGVLGTVPASPSGADYEIFRSAYQAAWNEEPSTFNANGYDAAYLLAMSMVMADNPDSGESLRAALGRTSTGQAVGPGAWAEFLALDANEANWAGASGDVDFDENGDVSSNISEWTISGAIIQSTGCWTAEGNACP